MKRYTVKTPYCQVVFVRHETLKNLITFQKVGEKNCQCSEKMISYSTTYQNEVYFFFFFLSQQRCALLHPVLRNENKTLTLSCQLGTPSPIPQPSDCASDVEPLHFNQQAKHPIFLKNKSLVIFEKPRRLFKGTLQLLTTVKRYEENINIYHACMYMRTRASFASAVGGDKVQRSAAACQQRQRRRPVACQHTCTQHKIRL